MTVEVTSKNVQDLRANFLKDLETKGESSGEYHALNNQMKDEIAVHPDDLERIKTTDDWLRRFLLHHDMNEKEALSMLWDTVTWRKEFKTNEITESNVSLDFIKEGVFFYHGRDKDGCSLFIFKSKKHNKGQLDFEEVKRAVIYWLERLERFDKGKPVSLFFDMEGCGVSNVDMELIKYIIHVFKHYYPNFLNYIIILEMAWILNALFKVIKAMLPEKAVEKIKMIKKNDLKLYVDPDQSLKCWGGNDNYVFVFESEEREAVSNHVTPNNKKVHFADGSPATEQVNFSDKDQGEGDVLRVHPSNIIMFVKEGNELVSTLELLNSDNQINISYKMKTTSPEKFRVRPSAGCLAPGGRATVTVSLLPGFELGGLSKDKFLVMSMPVESTEMSAQDLVELWKNAPGQNVTQHRLRCSQADEAKNGTVTTGVVVDSDKLQLSHITSKLQQLSSCQSELHKSVKSTERLQWIIMVLVLVLGVLAIFTLKMAMNNSEYCYKKDVYNGGEL